MSKNIYFNLVQPMIRSCTCPSIPVQLATYALYPPGYSASIKIHTLECNSQFNQIQLKSGNAGIAFSS
jgi:hypothetical protein